MRSVSVKTERNGTFVQFDERGRSARREAPPVRERSVPSDDAAPWTSVAVRPVRPRRPPREGFPAVSYAARHFDGCANFDEIVFRTKGFSGLTLRLYNPVQG
jgi:hypothetical protein